MKKSILILLCISLLAVMFTGCAAGNANTLGTTSSPSPTNTASAATTAPSTTFGPAASMTPTDDPMAGGMVGGMTDGMTGGMNNGANNGTTDGMTGGANAASSAAMTPADAGRLAEKIADAVERISEIDDAEVIVDGNRALVAVEFEDQYSAGLDERMKQQITQAVQKVDENLTQVEITDDGTLYGQVKSLAERVGKATGLDELADDIGDLWNRVTGR